MTLTQERPVRTAQPPPAAPQRSPRTFLRIWGVVGGVVVVALVLFVISGDDVPEQTLVLGPRHDGVVFVPEFVGRSGGDLPAIESSPLTMGIRHTDGFAYVPEFVGQSGGDLPAIESSALTMGIRHTDGFAYVPEFVAYADGIHPEDAR